MTSPEAPQPKQWKRPLEGVTVKEGVFSSMEGTRSNEGFSLPLNCDTSFAENRGEVVGRLDLFDPLFRNLHLSSPPFGWHRRPGP